MIALVLIDTWWNVNFVTSRQLMDVEQVLIDTWWNVNELDQKHRIFMPWF